MGMTPKEAGKGKDGFKASMRMAARAQEIEYEYDYTDANVLVWQSKDYGICPESKKRQLPN